MTGFHVRRATADDATALAEVAAVTFPLACPPTTTDAAKQAFIAAHLTAERFAEYLADPARLLFLAEDGEGALGYTMLVFGEPGDPDVGAAISLRPTVELSKCYTLPRAHGSGAASRLMTASLTALAELADRPVGVWLGVNQQNERAQRFYRKHGFERVGVKRFLVGDRWEDDFVYERGLGQVAVAAG
ncbi:GNAT family N-acetyltransferase [Agromyces larvae]|uniref:GNAT family N-acetyltransferase n=1 Tax=Agromyces larvae TaxID=2929802 RepID=A0ABY4BXJ5_9MICO|nr:GNAT family N-acetyltransferase [Agromyces larvae]UOE43955.1 GNAT family N-acetyltransferase [Agromyces larvae]